MRIRGTQKNFSPGRGFTLVEILMVVVILGLVGAIVIPQVGSRNDIIVAAAARVVVADLIYAQNRAINSQQKQYIIFSGQTYSLQTKSGSTMTTIKNPITHNNYSQAFSVNGTTFERVKINQSKFGAAGSMAYDELGSPLAFDGTNTTALISAGTIQLSCGSASLTINVQPFTGETTVQ